jgi:hypothetical protein
MPKLQLGGTEVCTSELTQRPFRAAPCELLIPVTARSKTKALATLKRAGVLGEYSGLRISGVSDLSFLKDFPELLYLEIVDQKNVNTRHLDGLENLRGLRLYSPGAGIDFACFPQLEVFVGDWHVDNCNVERSRELRRLCVWHFCPRSLDLSDLANSVRLEQLRITQTTVTSLAGLKTLEDLRYLTVEYAPKLESLDVLRDGHPEIRELRLSKAKGIRSYLPIASIGHLRRLQLTACAPMPNLKWVLGLNDLDFFSFVDTNVANNDLSPLLDLPKLQYVGTMNKRAYNYTSDALNELLSKRSSAATAARRRDESCGQETSKPQGF